MASDQEDVHVTTLGNPLVIRKIFGCLNTKDLLGVSSVNKLWNYEACCLLRDKRKCVAIIGGDRPCSRAKELNQLLGRLNVNFFTGLSIIIGPHTTPPSQFHMRVEDIYGNIVKTPWKYLKFKPRLEGTQDCILGQLMLRLMSASSTLEELVIRDVTIVVELKDTHLAGWEVKLPKLKILYVPESSIDKLGTEFLRDLFARAPNIEELQTIVNPHWLPLIPVEKLNIIQRLIIPYRYGENVTANEAIRLLDIICASEPKLTDLFAFRPSFRDANVGMMEEYFDRLVSIIYSSSETLRKVELDSFSIYKLSRTRRAKLFPPVLRNVENLKFEACQLSNSGIARYLLRVPLDRIFPSITRVKFFARLRSIPRANDEMEQAETYPWLAVKEVKLENVARCDQMVTELGILFPNLSVLEISFCNQVHESFVHVPFRQLWTSMPFLQKLIIHGKLDTLWKKNFDAEFCGIHPEEVDLLGSKDEQFLKAVNIVPPFAPITHVKGLKVMQLEVSACPAFLPKNKKILLSKVARLVALRRMPNLEFRLRVPFEVANQLDHLRAYVKLELLASNPTVMGNICDGFRTIK